MYKKITCAYPLEVKEIILNNGSALKNVTAWLVGDFLIVETGDRPNMYNIRLVDELRGVQEIRPHRNGDVWFM